MRDRDPGRAHVLEVERSRFGLFDVADELGEQPRLVRVAHRVVGLLDQGLRVDTAPREVVQRNSACLSLVDGHGVHARSRRHLVANGDDGVVAAVAGDV